MGIRDSDRCGSMPAVPFSLALGIWAFLAARGAGDSRAATPSISELYVDKARYEPGDLVTITAILESDGASPWSGDVALGVWRLEKCVHSATVPTTVAGSSAQTVVFSWTPPPDDFRGYLVRAKAGAAARYTAIDVSSDWRRYPRYGFLTNLYSTSSAADMEKDVVPLARNYHLSALQFYDWMWRHETVIDRAGGAVKDPWYDWWGLPMSIAGMKHVVSVCHGLNMATMPYFQIYVGLDEDGDTAYDYQVISGISPDWRLFYEKTGGGNGPFHSSAHAKSGTKMIFQAINPLEPTWIAHIVDEVEDAVTTVGFDGVHYDQLDKPGDFKSWRTAANAPLYLNTGFEPVLRKTRDKIDALPGATTERALTFNLVDGKIDYWHVNDVVWNASVDFLYSEIWTNETYFGLHKFIRWAREESGGKPIVVAAYVNKCKPEPGAPCPSHFADYAVRLADAAIFASGGFHLELGDGDQMLSAPYFRDTARKMSAELERAMRDYYNFSVAYEDLLFASEYVPGGAGAGAGGPPGLSYGDGGFQWIQIDGKNVYGNGVKNQIWYLTRRTARHEIIHLINLPDETEAGEFGRWRDWDDTVTPRTDLEVKYWIGPDTVVNAIHRASPDCDGGATTTITTSPTVGTDSRGRYVEFDVPRLEYWDMIYMDREIVAPGHRYQAEAAILFDDPGPPPPIGTSRLGYTGSGYVSLTGSASALASVSFWITVPRHSGYGLEVRYSNQSTTTPQVGTMYVDGNEAGKLHFQPLQPEAVWGTTYVDAYLRAGPHQVVVQLDTAGPVQLDYLQPCLPINGLKGEYFSTRTLNELAFTRTDRKVDFDWGKGVPDSEPFTSWFPSNDFSVRWTGAVVPRYGESYVFHLRFDDGARLWVDGRLLIDEWTDHAATTISSPPLALAAGKKYPIALEYYERTADALVQLSWSSASQFLEVIPADRLLPSMQDPEPGLPPPFIRGDTDLDGAVKLTDAIQILNHVEGWFSLPCEDACDVDDSGVVDSEDATALLTYLYHTSMAPPVCPFPHCGRDLTPDSLTCSQSPCW